MLDHQIVPDLDLSNLFSFSYTILATIWQIFLCLYAKFHRKNRRHPRVLFSHLKHFSSDYKNPDRNFSLCPKCQKKQQIRLSKVGHKILRIIASDLTICKVKISRKDSGGMIYPKPEFWVP